MLCEPECEIADRKNGPNPGIYRGITGLLDRPPSRAHFFNKKQQHEHKLQKIVFAVSFLTAMRFHFISITGILNICAWSMI